MRSAVALCFLTVLWTIDATPTFKSVDLDYLRLQVRNAKWNVDSIIRQLQLLRTQTEEDTIIEVTNKWDDEKKSYRAFKTLFLIHMKKEVDAAKLAGMDVDSCHKEALDGIEGTEQVAYDDASECINVAQSSIENDLNFLDNLIWTGNELLLKLDSIFLNCHDSDELKMQSCIIADLAKVNADIRTLRSDTNYAELTVVRVSDNVVLQATNCLKTVYSSVYSAADMIQMRLHQCIKLKNEPTTTTTKTTTKKPTTKTTTEESRIFKRSL